MILFFYGHGSSLVLQHLDVSVRDGATTELYGGQIKLLNNSISRWQHHEIGVNFLETTAKNIEGDALIKLRLEEVISGINLIWRKINGIADFFSPLYNSRIICFVANYCLV